MKKKKIAAYVLSAVCALGTVTPLCALAEESDDDKLEDLMTSEFVDTMEDDYMTLHFTLKDPSALNIEVPEPTFGNTDFKGEAEKAKSDAEKVLKELDDIDRDSLTEEHQYDYDVMVDSYTYQKNWSDTNWEWMFTADNNLVNSITTNMTEFQFYDKQDFYDYVSVLDTVDDYVNAALDLTKEQADNGYFMNEASLEESLSEIKDFTDKTDDNPLIVDFKDDADASSFLSEEEKGTLENQVNDIVINDIIPACTNAYDTLSGMKDKCVDDFSDIENGLAYYTAAEQHTVGSAKSLQDQFDELDDFIQDKTAEYISLLQKNPDAGSTEISMKDPDEILTYLSNSLNDHGFPDCPDVNYTADYLDPSVVSGNVMAYYMSSPLDDYTDNVIRINKNNISDNTEFYNTLAHEGYPGHLYQHVYDLSKKHNYIRQLCGYLGYQEGWAEYVANDAMEWGIMSDEDAKAVELNNDITYGLSALTDIAVHGLGWQEKDVSSYLRRIGLNSEAASSLYQTAMQYPISYDSYGYGLCRFTVMRENAEEALGDKFDKTEFHEVILDHSDRMLDTVETDVENWVKQKGGKYSSSDTKSSSSSNSSTSPLSRSAAFGIGMTALVVVVVAFIVRARNRRNSAL
ncbi:MAG: DUF885 domain-containing protein [Solobacterium sp.]|jgi:uncharacterized protein (DUF885 family)|nr:DUF885 domain-containing protein [Solobacterium sp.]MCH4049428.1 DUF885 domain-containing protein [Solobacterium sp.]MCH4075284.1 DUF885 domain-containing protein [Solobacterium sp.]MCI1314366.1 DUF885 domain-containing protein [Solobacterium sp.]MCI1346525.1 DUF885 domain-containing protein [Solobacterium sp.]